MGKGGGITDRTAEDRGFGHSRAEWGGMEWAGMEARPHVLFS